MGHGHSRIAIIKGTERNSDAAERFQGYLDAHRERGVAVDQALQVAGDFGQASGYQAAQQLLALPVRPTAIFSSNDAMAIGALSALRDAGIQVPGEIALAGFDDVPMASFLTPSLTSVSVDIHNLGVLAIQTVLHAVSHKNEHHKQQVLLPTSLQLRESCGCRSTNPITQ
jgi:LacI family transcriptional regulator